MMIRQSKNVFGFNKDGTFFGGWPSIKECARSLKREPSTVREAINKRNFCNGLVLQFIPEFMPIEKRIRCRSGVPPKKNAKVVPDENTVVVPDTNGYYYVTRDGRIINMYGRELQQKTTLWCEYLTVNLQINKRKTHRSVHRIVAQAFLSNPENKSQVNHDDGNKKNNNISNLGWMTPKENMKHAIDKGLYKRYNNQTYKGKFGKDHNRSLAVICKNTGNVYGSISEASRELKISISTIHYSISKKVPLKNGLEFSYHQKLIK